MEPRVLTLVAQGGLDETAVGSVAAANRAGTTIVVSSSVITAGPAIRDPGASA